MAVFTEVPFEEAAPFLRRLGLGELRAMAACNGGIENNNYFVDTNRGEYVLTLFERLASEQLSFYLHLMQHLASRGVPVPKPAPDGWRVDLDSGGADAVRRAAFLTAYESVRPLVPEERHLLPALERAAALRFWISRLWDCHISREAAVLKAHDPRHFERVLRRRVSDAAGAGILQKGLWVDLAPDAQP